MIRDSIVKFGKSENLSDKKLHGKYPNKNLGCTSEDITDYIKPIIRRKPDIILVHTGTNDLTNSVNPISKVR